MTCTGLAPEWATYQTPSPFWLNGAPEVTHMPPRASNVRFEAYGIPAATTWPGGGAAAAPGAHAAATAARTAMCARLRLTRRPYRRGVRSPVAVPSQRVAQDEVRGLGPVPLVERG